jgi:hypothetical protein
VQSSSSCVVTVDRTGHLIANARCTPSLDLDAIRTRENLSDVTCVIAFVS